MKGIGKEKEDIKREWKDVDLHVREEIAAILRRYDYSPLTMLGWYVSSICDIDFSDMLSSSDKTHIAQSRWLFWYAYRYMTNETYEQIAQRCAIDGCAFSCESVRVGCSKMSVLIERDFMWRRRWEVIKDIIKLGNEALNEVNESKKRKITLNISDGIEVEIKKK